MSAQRPRTSKPRGVCRYYTTPRGCFAGSSCKFLHGDDQKLTPYDQSKTCRYYTAGYCRRGADCWFLHSDPGPAAKVVASPIASDDDDYVCSICLEKPVTFGLLAGCDHIFCLECIRQWRNPPVTPEDGAVDRLKKCCPLCRVASPFVTPSSHFYSSTHPGKAATINQYKASMARVPCRYFQASLHSSQRFCPFGKDCFYQHKNEDGSDHVFAEGVEHYIKPDSGTRSRGRFTFTSSDDYVDTPWIEEMSATLDAIRASLPDFLQQPLDEGEDDSENDDHPHRLQVEQLRSEPFAALLEVLDYYGSEGAGLEAFMFPSTLSESPPRPSIMYSDPGTPPRAFDLFSQVTHEETHLPESNRVSIEHPRFSTIVTDRGDATDSPAVPLLSAGEPLAPAAANEINPSQNVDAATYAGIVNEDEDARLASLGSIPMLAQSEVEQHEASHTEDMWSFDPALQIPEPPVLTDGRGRVVWSSMSASRNRHARSRVEQKANRREAHANPPTSPSALHPADSTTSFARRPHATPEDNETLQSSHSLRG